MRIVDDSCLWNENITDHVKQVCEYLHLTGSNGIIQNPDKFVFGRRSLEYVGFQLTPDGIRPSDKMLEDIKSFPRPTSISGIRSWFGIIEQVAYAFSKTDLMEPFCLSLKKDEEFVWNDKLQEAFDKTKEDIFSQVSKAVQTFVL